MKPQARKSAAGTRQAPDMDAVVTWVDGSDAAYQSRRAAEGARRGFALDAHTAQGTTAREELRYCLRGLAQHAPWLRRIVLVTDGQWPRWLDEAAAAAATPPIVRVDHAALHPDGRSMYGSSAIEATLHRIPGLSDLFLYANSDMYLTAPLEAADLVQTEGRRVAVFRVDRTVPRILLTPLARGEMLRQGQEWVPWFLRCVTDQLHVFERITGAQLDAYPKGVHQMQVLCRDCIEHACAAEPALWRATVDAFGRVPATASDPPRHIGRVCFEALALWRGHAVAVDKGDPAKLSTYVNASTAALQLRQRPPARFLCINNVESQPPETQRDVMEILEALLPIPLTCEAASGAADPLACWTRAQLERAVPRGTKSLAVVATAVERRGRGDLPEAVEGKTVSIAFRIAFRHGVAELVQQLRAQVGHVLVLHNGGDGAAIEAPSEWLEHVGDGRGSVSVAGMADGGLDFGQWARALRPLEEPLTRLVLANDSTLPLQHRSLDVLFEHPRVRGPLRDGGATRAGFWGVTDSMGRHAVPCYHLQSYFLVAEGASATHSVLAFLRARDLPRLAALPRDALVEECEFGLTQWMVQQGHGVVAAYPFQTVYSMRTTLNLGAIGEPAKCGWDRLVLLGDPLLKRRLVPYAGWQQFLAEAAERDAGVRGAAAEG